MRQYRPMSWFSSSPAVPTEASLTSKLGKITPAHPHWMPHVNRKAPKEGKEHLGTG